MKVYGVLAAAAVFLALPAAAQEAASPEHFKYGLTSDGRGVAILGLNGEFTTVRIPAAIEGYPVVEIADYAGLSCEAVTIPETVTVIGKSVFQGAALKTLRLPENLKTIAPGLFARCASLTSVAIPEGVTSIGSGAFSECVCLESIALPEGVTQIGSLAFAGCTALTSVTLPSRRITYWGDSFARCPRLPLPVRQAIQNTGYKGRF